MRQHKFNVIKMPIAPPLVDGLMQCFWLVAQAVDEDDGCVVLSQRLDNVRAWSDRNGNIFLHYFCMSIVV